MSEHAKHECGICALIALIAKGENPDFIAELPNSHVVLGPDQFYRGYCIVLAKTHAREPFLVPREESIALYEEVLGVAAAIDAVTHPFKMNYACLGNLEPHVHWHLYPRYADDELNRGPVWIRPEAQRRVALEEHDRRALIASLRAEISRRIPLARLALD